MRRDIKLRGSINVPSVYRRFPLHHRKHEVRGMSTHTGRGREGNTCKCVWPASGGGRCFFFFFFLSLSLPPSVSSVFGVLMLIGRLPIQPAFVCHDCCFRGREFSKFCAAYMYTWPGKTRRWINRQRNCERG